ncbi:chemotaxis protein CheW [uncultured Pseudoteredinibacter sp.]|uniref:chemotaxis protein CheW n=1 Tax=uncultured Pseudoteredinibacter sp. TaxID=1641701 RepID=UPI00260FE400|nr:chemotaxis protein CheW [uncultured Pseudoteredinibacter sp.]
MEQLAQERPTEVPSLAVPVAGFTLLLPTISVAEMVPYRKSRFIPAEQESVGYIGRYEWRDQQVPLLSFEELNGLPRGEVSGYNQVAIINATGISSELAYVAVIAQGIPHVARVTPEAIQELPDAPDFPYVKMTVIVDGQEAAIPDVPALEAMAAEL